MFGDQVQLSLPPRWEAFALAWPEGIWRLGAISDIGLAAAPEGVQGLRELLLFRGLGFRV